jgi:CheY-like chemotaxis protein
MPYVDGRTVATTIKSRAPAVPIVLLTGWGYRLQAENDIPQHVDSVLSKPAKLQELRAVIAELAGAARASAGITAS